MRLAASALTLLPAAFSMAADPPKPVAVAGLSAPPPADWKAEKPANLLRSHQFKLAAGDKDTADAEVIVMPQSSSDVPKAFDKWKGQYTPPDDKKAADVTKEDKFDVTGAKAHLLDVSGTWKYRERPNDPKTEKTLPEYRTIWVVVVGKDETAHLRLSGPQAVVAKYEPEFLKWVKALK